MLEVIQFIRENSDWEERLSQAPYFISVSRDEFNGRKLMILRYSQIESDFKIPLVRECRGLILDAETFEPVCVPFFKFGNYGESYCPQIDWSTARVGEKLDGSLIKIVKLPEGLLVSTNGTILAKNANLQGAEWRGHPHDFFELAWLGLNYYGLDWSDLSELLDENVTYLFELTSPYNKVVVQWKETRLNYLGCRDNITLQEHSFNEGRLSQIFNTPRVFELNSLESCIAAAKELPFNEEGYVVCDANFNRVKVKSPAYVCAHHIRGEGQMTYERALGIIRTNEVAEVLNYFPEWGEQFERLSRIYHEYIARLDSEHERVLEFLNEHPNYGRREIALWIQANSICPGFCFKILDGKIGCASDWVSQRTDRALVSDLELKERDLNVEAER